MVAPTSQKADARPISFLLSDSRTNTTVSVPLTVRPEDLTRVEPALQTTIPTFGGAFVDDFGPGVTRIQIAGTTGWRGGADGDGLAQFTRLHQTVWTQWHQARQDALDAGQSVDGVKLIFSDALDDMVCVVAPASFTLKRNRSRPLLIMYDIALTVLSQDLDQPNPDDLDFTAASDPGASNALASGTDSLLDSSARIDALAPQVAGPTGFTSALGAYAGQATSLFRGVAAALNPASGVVDPTTAALIGLAGRVAVGGRNALFSYGALAGLDAITGLPVAQMAAAFENAACVLKNALTGRLYYPDYSGLYGASSCSSTVGGSPLSPLAGVNPFEVLTPVTTPPASLNAPGRGALEILTSSDPVLAPTPVGDLTSYLNSVGSGLVAT